MKMTRHKGILVPATDKEWVDKELDKMRNQGIDPFTWLMDYFKSIRQKPKQERKKIADQMLADMKQREKLRQAKRN